MKCVIAARSTENIADSCAKDGYIMIDDERNIFRILEICNKRNKFFQKVTVIYLMHMLDFSPYPFITAHRIDIHIAAFATSPLIATPSAYLL